MLDIFIWATQMVQKTCSVDSEDLKIFSPNKNKTQIFVVRIELTKIQQAWAEIENHSTWRSNINRKTSPPKLQNSNKSCTCRYFILVYGEIYKQNANTECNF